MIILGVFAIIIGGVLYFNGNSINNNLDAQMESIFNDGISNPGSTDETIGIFCIIVGIILLIIGVMLSFNKKDEENKEIENSEISADHIENKKEGIICQNCGFDIVENSKFCVNCGQAVIQNSEDELICTYCENANPKGSKFCRICGKAI